MRDREERWLREQLRDLERTRSDHERLTTARHIANLCRQRVERHDPYTKEHSVRVARWARLLARRIPTFDRARLDRLEITALVHDYGKVDIDPRILNKPGRLEEEEFEEVKRHPERGAMRLEPFRDFLAVEGVLYHHVRYEGGGYPGRMRLKRHQIPIEARIIAVADTFDALTSTRAYRTGRSPQEALGIMLSEAGRQLDPVLVHLFASYYRMEARDRGYEPGAMTIELSALMDEEIRRAREFLRAHVGSYDRRDPLRHVADREAFVRAAIAHLESLSVSAEDAEKFVRAAYRLPLEETFLREDIALSDGEYAQLLAGLRDGGGPGHREVCLPIRRWRERYLGSEIVVFDQKLWKCVVDGNRLILLR
ncbi:MAG: HD domain-containing protein [Planctomycetota bacterium]|nr:MAG: HD domain-containing protein [Planctomycetota bacterium]